MGFGGPWCHVFDPPLPHHASAILILWTKITNSWNSVDRINEKKKKTPFKEKLIKKNAACYMYASVINSF